MELEEETSRPRWEFMVESPTIERVPSNYRIKLKYGGFFRQVKNSHRKRYCFGSQKSIYTDVCLYDLNQLTEEVMHHYPSKSDLVFFMQFLDKNATEQKFINLNSDTNFEVMLRMYEEEKEVTVYVTTEKAIERNEIEHSGQDEVVDEAHHEEDPDSDYCPSEDSYHSLYNSDTEAEFSDHEGESYEYCKKNPVIEVNSKFPSAVAFGRVVNHHALINEFLYCIEKSEPTRFTASCASIDCEWRVHASVLQDGVTFEVKKLVKNHSCIRSNKCGNKFATQGWVADVVIDKLKSDGDVPPTKLRKWLMKKYNVDVPYMRVDEEIQRLCN